VQRARIKWRNGRRFMARTGGGREVGEVGKYATAGDI
jgi:hypothetical protein